MFKQVIIFFGVVFLNLSSALSQDVEMADGFRADGKIYVVIGVILIILAGLFVYLFRIEKKVKKLEQE